ncbi:hypothetical protein D3C71_1723440 [compost metagenome]
MRISRNVRVWLTKEEGLRVIEKEKDWLRTRLVSNLTKEDLVNKSISEYCIVREWSDYQI